MPTFDWRDSVVERAADPEPPDEWTPDWDALSTRYETARDAVGVRDWVSLVLIARELAEDPGAAEWRVAGVGESGQPSVRAIEWLGNVERLLDAFIRRLNQTPPPASATPTVFVSHQRWDAAWAERAAWAATERHFDYWLDIHDPLLVRANASALPPPIKTLLIAGIIEMALLNSSHLLSLQTTNALGSRWVPYEYGRAKERRALATNAVSWFEKGIGPGQAGDYLWLGTCAFTESALEQWLDRTGRTPPPWPNPRWAPRPVPPALPN